MTQQPSPRPRRRGSFVPLTLKLLGSSLVLWLPLLGWELGERWSSRAPQLRDRPPAEWSTPAPLGPAQSPTAAQPASLQVVQLPGSPSTPALSMSAGDPAPIPAPAFNADIQLQSTPLEESTPWLLTALRGAAGLGGEINLDNVNEKLMPVAARAERQHWQSSGDPLSPLPRHWRDELRREVGQGNKVLQAEVVRIPAPHLTIAEEIPLAIRANGQAESLVPPPSARSQQVVETWASRQSPIKEGEVRAVVLTLEPIELSSRQAQPAPAPAPADDGSTPEPVPSPP